MNMRIKKALADLTANRSRTSLVIFALILGIWGAGSILVSYAILSRDLSTNFQRTTPSQAVLTSPDFTGQDLSGILKRPEVERAEFRDLAFLRIEVQPDVWIPLWLFGVTDFAKPALATLTVQAGAAVPPPGTILIERDGLHISNLSLGSLAPVRSEGTVRSVPISGIAFDPAQAPATQDHFIYAYADQQTFAQLTGTPSNRRLLVRIRHAASRQDVQAGVDALTAYLKTRNVTVTSAIVPKFNEHPHQWQLNTLLFVVGVIGFLAFFMGAVLVNQLMASMLAAQVRQIGVMKAMGASRAKILQIYLVMLAIFGISAGVVAIPAALATGYAFARFVAKVLNFEILTAVLPGPIYLALVAVSILLPIALSMRMLLRSTAVSALTAISDYGIPQDAGFARTSPSLGAFIPPTLLLAFRNATRNKGRVAVTVASMALGVAIFDTGFNVRESLAILLAGVKSSMRYDVQVVLTEQRTREALALQFKDIANVARIESWNGGRGELQSQVVSTNAGVGFIALPAGTTLLNAKLTAGRWLRTSVEPEVVLNQQAVEFFKGPRVGDQLSLTIAGKPLVARVVGVAEEFDKPKIYLDEQVYDALANPSHSVNSLLFVAKRNSYAEVVVLKKDVERSIAQSDLKVLYVMSQAERVKVIYDHLNIILTVLVVLAFLVLTVSALGMTSATSINILERTREIGIMRAIGATPERIYRLFVLEGVIVSVASIVLGLALSYPLSRAASYFFGSLMLGEGAVLHYAFSVTGFLITLLTTFGFGIMASRLPARTAIAVSTREALAYE